MYSVFCTLQYSTQLLWTVQIEGSFIYEKCQNKVLNNRNKKYSSA